MVQHLIFEILSETDTHAKIQHILEKKNIFPKTYQILEYLLGGEVVRG